MLRSLTIKNFAIIDEQKIELAPGLNVLTGETGAGKSILIEALGFLLGGRGSAGWLRSGAQRLEVTGAFDREDFPRELRAQFKIADSPVLARRELDSAGRARGSLNAQPASAAALSALGESLVDFHGQHEHQTLLKPSVQLELLDRFGSHEGELAEMGSAYEAWAALRAELESAQMSDEERRRRIEFGRFQLQEIGEADPRPGEEEELEAALPLLKNAERIKTLAAGAYEVLYGQEGSVMGGLLKVERTLGELVRIDSSMKASHEELEAARLALEEVARVLGGYQDRVEMDPGRLDGVLSRLELFSRLKKKYGATMAEVLAARERAAAELSRLENSEQRLGELGAGFKKAEKRLERTCAEIHEARMKAARRLEKAVLSELKVLGMPQARFSASLEMEEGRFSRNGSDAAEFMLAANPGEPLKPVKAVASGGELSRVMLALKTVLAQADRVPILVFDEVDAGIGGAVARAVGRKLSVLGRTRQVLCVTHLAQVACFADAHLRVIKEVAGGRTSVKVARIEGDERLDALALMLGGRQATPASLRHAQELLQDCVP